MNASALTVLPLAAGHAPLARVGGKARSLAKLAAAGFPVPDGFLLSTAAYQGFVQANDLQDSIQRFVAEAAPGLASNELASAGIRSLFEAARLPSETADAIAQAYAALGKDEPAVAVRSSATAEDLPHLSFAGQHDTYLNIRGEAALCEAVRRCWASLWTAQAIAYRLQMGIDQRAVAMGVVVQVMVQADVSGILFTVNPAGGDRSELVVNASFGLGEAVVAGRVTPDTYVLDRSSLEPKTTVISTKETMIVPTLQGTAAEPVPERQRNQSSLSKEVLRELATLSMDVERLFEGVPQDIEWAVADGNCWLLQSRPITNLPAAPPGEVSWDPPSKGAKLIRRQVVENMPEPLSPLFEELYLQVGLEHAIDQVMAEFGMPFDVEAFIERPMFVTVNGYAYCRGNYRSAWRLVWTMPKVLCAYVRILPRLLRNLIPDWRDKDLPAYLKTIQQWKSVDLATASDEQLLSGVRALAVADANYWFKAAMILGAAKVTEGLLNRFLRSRFVPGKLTSGMFLRGFPSKTMEAQRALEAIAGRIRKTEPLRELVLATPARDLPEALDQEPGGHATKEDIRQYLQEYGHQIYNLDFVEPTQMEDPMPVLLSLKALLKNEGYDTPARQADMIQERDARVTKTLGSLSPLPRWLFRKLLGWAQTYGPYREETLFYMGAAWPTLRRLALELGERLVERRVMATPDDVFYLKTAELTEACAAGKEDRASSDFGQIADQRRQLRQARKRLHPPGMIPEQSKFTFGPFDFSAFETQKRNADDANTLNGFAVSPGKVTGPASVILSPADFEQMQPDTILVCPTTTPAWTPLFSQASGLATDIGGILAHGSIVAREYGIPAVMGTGTVTQRVVRGQRITVDGDTGTVTIQDRRYNGASRRPTGQ